MILVLIDIIKVGTKKIIKLEQAEEMNGSKPNEIFWVSQKLIIATFQISALSNPIG